MKLFICVKEGFDAVCIHNTSSPDISFWSRIRKVERDCYEDDDLNVAARFFRREVFLKLGGYNEKLIAGEDYDLHNRLVKAGYKVGRASSREVHIGEPRSLRDVVEKHYYYGKTIMSFVKCSGTKGLKQLSPIRPAYLRHAREVVKNPILLRGFLFYQFIRYQSALLGVLASLIP